MSPEQFQTYKIGEYIYVELQNFCEPFWICKIEEIQKMQDGDTQIKVKLFYRRCQVEENLLTVADKYTDCFLRDDVFDWDIADDAAYNSNYVKLHYKLLQRYLFVTKENMIISPDLIRGRCYVFLLSTVESPEDVLTDEDKFFFLLAYDLRKQEVHEDKGSIMYGTQYQAELPLCNKPDYFQSSKETQLWDPSRCPDVTYAKLTSMTRSLHALKSFANCNLKTRPVQVHQDVHILGAMEMLNNNNYDLNSTASELVTKKSHSSDEFDSWNRDEILIFERALSKYGKQFHYIRQEFLPWKSWVSIIKLYYRWKGSKGYKLWKQNYSSELGDVKEIQVAFKEWTNPSLTETSEAIAVKCPGCSKLRKNEKWHSWGPQNEPVQVCKGCSTYWKKYSGFPDSPELEGKTWVTKSPIHQEMPHSELFKCQNETCDRSFKSKSALNRHQAQVHGQSCIGALFVCTKDSLKMRKSLNRQLLRKMARKPHRL